MKKIEDKELDKVAGGTPGTGDGLWWEPSDEPTEGGLSVEAPGADEAEPSRPDTTG